MSTFSNTAQTSTDMSALWVALGITPSEMDRGSRFDAMSYESEDSMPPLVTPPKPTLWGPPATAEMPPAPKKGCDLHWAPRDDGAPPALGYSTNSWGEYSTFAPRCACPPENLTSALDAAAAPFEPWGENTVYDLQTFWHSKIARRRSEEHAHEIDHLVEYIYDNNADTLAEEFKQKMENAKSARDLKVDVYMYNHTTPNGDDLRLKPYTDSTGEIHTTLQEFLHEKGFETTVPSGWDDVHWLVTKTNFLEKLAARFGAANFTASYKLTFKAHPDRKVFFYSEGVIRLHFWPNGVRK